MAGSSEREPEQKATSSSQDTEDELVSVKPKSKAKKKKKKKKGFSPAPPWAPFPWQIHRLWVLGLGCFGCLVVCAVCIVETANAIPVTNHLDLRWLCGAVVSFGGAAALLLAFNTAHWTANPTGRFFEWLDYVDRQEKRERQVAARRRQRPPPEPMGAAYWMNKLSTRLGRLKRFKELNAPEPIIEQEKRMIRDAIAELDPAQALYTLRSWPELEQLFDPRKHTDKPDAKQN